MKLKFELRQLRMYKPREIERVICQVHVGIFPTNSSLRNGGGSKQIPTPRKQKREEKGY